MTAAVSATNFLSVALSFCGVFLSFYDILKTLLIRDFPVVSRIVYLQTSLDRLVDPARWLEWKGNFALKTLYYQEYNNSGPGSSTTGRVTWDDYRVIKDEAKKFTTLSFIGGQSWLPNTSVPLTPGL
ncbi:hypothetical protein ACSBR1_026800 [Camellia fascicularis]